MTDSTKSDIAPSPDPADERRAALAALLPEAFSDGRLDVAALKRALGEAVVIDSPSRSRILRTFAYIAMVCTSSSHWV